VSHVSNYGLSCYKCDKQYVGTPFFLNSAVCVMYSGVSGKRSLAIQGNRTVFLHWRTKMYKYSLRRYIESTKKKMTMIKVKNQTQGIMDD